MWATYLRTLCDRHRTRQCTGHAAAIQLACDFFGAVSTGFVQALEVASHDRGSRIKAQRNNVDAYPTPLA
jgi:hypothetical protein